MVFALDCMQDDRTPLSDTEEEENCEPEEPSQNPDQVLGLWADKYVIYTLDMQICYVAGKFDLSSLWKF